MDGETVFAIVFGTALAVFSLVMVGYSFFRRRVGSGPAAETVSEVSQLESANGPSIDSIYDSIYTLELEYHLGNLPEQQFQEQFQAYRLQAAAALKEQLEKDRADPLLLLEQEVMEARSALQDKGAHVPDCPACPDCSGPVPAEAAACPHCGAELPSRRAAHSVEEQADESR